MGLSPRTRGNLAVAARIRLRVGSIPANAGEPTLDPRRDCAPWVYPRERGGTLGGRQVCEFDDGLSPRTRGNPRQFRLREELEGSIPANAGEPICVHVREPCRRVYPRERGGTPSIRQQAFLETGLSPRTRGNPGAARRHRGASGSIPANAGEPPSRFRPGAMWRVYPRERREPPENPPGAPQAKVYPRERGGTDSAASVAFGARGLSPRTRGNHRPEGVADRAMGSIPANAGEPPACC